MYWLACENITQFYHFKLGGMGSYLVTTFKVVPRGTEGAVSVEGTLAGLLASILLASIGCFMGEV